MINPISNVSFKGVYSPKYTKFTESQDRVLSDIKTKLGQEKEKSNFLAKPKGNDSLELLEICGLKTKGQGLDKKITYNTAIHIGTYDEKCPFKLEDYKNVKKKQIQDFVGIIIAPFIVFGIIFGINQMKNKSASPEQTEKVMTITKDSLKTAKDSLKIFK